MPPQEFEVVISLVTYDKLCFFVSKIETYSKEGRERVVSPPISLHRSRWFEVTNNRVRWLVSSFSKRPQQSGIVNRIASVGLEWKLSLPRSTSLIPIRALIGTLLAFCVQGPFS